MITLIQNNQKAKGDQESQNSQSAKNNFSQI